MRRPSSRAIVRSTTDGATAVSSKQANGPRPPIVIPTTTWFATKSNGTAIRVTLDVRLTLLGPVGLTISRRLKGDPAKWVPPIVSGAVLPKLKATRVAVVWKAGSLSLRLKGNSFLGGSPSLYMPPVERFPFTVVADDA